VAALPRVAWDNAAHSLLERTLDDSANRREVLPSAYLAVDEVLRAARRIVGGLRVNEGAIARDMEVYGVFAATERLLMMLVKAGANRQEMHEVIRTHSLAAWEALQADAGSENPLAARLCSDEQIASYLASDEVLALLDASAYVGDAPERARAVAARLRGAAGNG
jgi:adenylosuccinate lyase